MRASMFQLFSMVAFAASLAACQSTGGMSALAPSVAAGRPPMLVDAVRGPAPEIAQRFEAILMEEARKRGYLAASGAAGPVMRLKAYLDAFSAEGGKTGFAWVIETSEDGRSRTIRVKGAAEMPGGGASPWSSFDEKAMRQIATLALDDLTRQSDGAAQIAAAAPAEE